MAFFLYLVEIIFLLVGETDFLTVDTLYFFLLVRVILIDFFFSVFYYLSIS